MLSSLDALAEKISPGSGKNSPNQQQSPQNISGGDIIMTAAGTANTNITSGMVSATAIVPSSMVAATIGSKTHFSQNIHPYQKLEHTNNNNNREK